MFKTPGNGVQNVNRAVVAATSGSAPPEKIDSSSSTTSKVLDLSL
jgi:hypothetical protein